MKIVVTGALGHIGSRVIRQIPVSNPGAEIVMIDNMLTQRYCSLFNLPSEGAYHFIEVDVLTMDLTSVLKDCDAVIHLAAIADAARSFQNKARIEKVNYNATVTVADACCKVGCPMIFISSTSVYGSQKALVDEDCSGEDLQPQSPYAETKLREERYLQSKAIADGLRFVICRFGTICGVSPGMRFHTAVNKFSWQAVMGQPLTVWRTALHQKRPYLVLDDAIRALCFILDKQLFDGNVYNVLTDNLTVNSIIELIKRDVPDIDVEYVDSEIMNQLSYEVSNLRFINQGFKFDGNMANSISDTINLLKKAGGI